MSITTATAGSRPRTGIDARDRIFYSGWLAMAITEVWLGIRPVLTQ